MTEAEKRAVVAKFYNDWGGIDHEKRDGQSFWIEFLSNVLEIEDVTRRIMFENRVIVDGQMELCAHLLSTQIYSYWIS